MHACEAEVIILENEMEHGKTSIKRNIYTLKLTINPYMGMS